MNLAKSTGTGSEVQVAPESSDLCSPTQVWFLQSLMESAKPRLDVGKEIDSGWRAGEPVDAEASIGPP